MTYNVFSAAVFGIDSKLVEVEVDVSQGFPGFQIVGLPDAAIQESKERVRSALKNCGFSFPYTMRVTVNLAPADLKKEGPVFDLPIILGLLSATGVIPAEKLKKTLCLGELALDGRIRSVRGILAGVLLAKKKKFEQVFVPVKNAKEAALVSGIRIYPFANILEIVAFLNDKQEFVPQQQTVIKDYLGLQKQVYDFAEVRGQEQAKRVMEIVAAGGHSLFMVGPPGSGKTLLAKTLVSILPSMNEQEVVEATNIYSVAGLLNKNKPLITQRPFRSPHHTASAVALVGGGQVPRPGEISLAHRGVLFLDELPEFSRAVLEALRQPLEDRVISVSRAQYSIEFPADSILIAAYNPCPCGYLNDEKKDCSCTPLQIARYQKKISGPILDRADLHITIPRLSHQKLSLAEKGKSEKSVVILARVEATRQIQTERFKDEDCLVNSEMNNKQIEKYCQLDPQGLGLLAQAVKDFALSPRGYFKTIKIARTIADLSQDKKILASHIAEALQYRIRQEN